MPKLCISFAYFSHIHHYVKYQISLYDKILYISNHSYLRDGVVKCN